MSGEVKCNAKAEYAKSGRSTCRLCKSDIEKKELRLGLMLWVAGYKNPHWMHFNCFWKHKETPKKIYNLAEIFGQEKLEPEDRKRVVESFEELHVAELPMAQKASQSKKKRKAGDDNDDGDQEKKKSKKEPKEVVVKAAATLFDKVVNCVELLNNTGTKVGLSTLKKALTQYYKVDVTKQAANLKKAIESAVKDKQLLKFTGAFASFVHPTTGCFQCMHVPETNKTWEILVLGSTSYREWYPTYGKGSSIDDHSSHDAAKKAMEKHVRQKLQKGFTQVSATMPATTTTTTTTAFSPTATTPPTVTSAITSETNSEIIKKQKEKQDEPAPVNGSACVVCLDQTRDSLLYSCGHYCLCNSCAVELKRQKQSCPVCRAPIQKIVRVFPS